MIYLLGGTNNGAIADNRAVKKRKNCIVFFDLPLALCFNIKEMRRNHAGMENSLGSSLLAPVLFSKICPQLG